MSMGSYVGSQAGESGASAAFGDFGDGFWGLRRDALAAMSVQLARTDGARARVNTVVFSDKGGEKYNENK
jgi:hypothetical protein